MAKQSNNSLDGGILGKTLREWNSLWQRVPGGFKAKHPELRHHIGLARALLSGETMYILRGIEAKGGIEKGLQRIRGCEQTGNAGYGARRIREHIDELQLEVLFVEDASAAKRLKTAMINYHDPEWNKPAKRRVERLRAGFSV